MAEAALCGARAAVVDKALVSGNLVALRDEGIPAPLELLGGDLETAARIAEQEQHSLAPILNAVLAGRSDIISSAPVVDAYISAVASLYAFIRANFCGPPLELTQKCAPRVDLSLDGEDPPVEPKLSHLLHVAETVLLHGVQRSVSAGISYAHWWAARVAMVHHAVLGRATPTLHERIFRNFLSFLGESSSARDTLRSGAPLVGELKDSVLREVLDEGQSVSAESVIDGLEDASENELLALANIELSVAQSHFYDAVNAAKSLARASHLAGIQVLVRGELGVRTKFQQKPTSQLISHVFSLSESGLGGKGCHALRHDFPRSLAGGHGEDETDDSRQVQGRRLPKNVPLNDSDVLGYVRLVDDPAGETPSEDALARGLGPEIEDLSPVEQAIVLAKGSLELARSAGHELTNEEAAPHINRILSSVRSKHGTSSVLQIRALSLRTQFEYGRGRYMERNMSQMEEISQFVDSCGPVSAADSDVPLLSASERGSMTLASALPPRWELKKMLAVSLGQLGLVKSAMEIFEELELWDELVDCHRLVGNLGVAEELVRVQLSRLDVNARESIQSNGNAAVEHDLERARSLRTSRRPRLLCVLGDILRDTSFYDQAWTESNSSYGRAKRSLGRIACERKDWASAVRHFEDALKVNPLFPDIWYLYGCSAMQMNEMRLAAIAFTNVVRESPNNAEAWNNLARTLHDMDRPKESLSAFLQAANKKRDSWRIWDNVLQLATELRATNEIVRAMEHMLDLRGKDGMSSSSISVAVDEVINLLTGSPQRATTADPSTVTSQDRAAASQTSRALLKLLARATTMLSNDAGLWDAYARLNNIVPGKESKRKSAECRQRQLRVLLSRQNYKLEEASFRIVAKASLAYATTALDSEDQNLIHSASLHVQSMLKQTEEIFGTDRGYGLLLEARDVLSGL